MREGAAVAEGQRQAWSAHLPRVRGWEERVLCYVHCLHIPFPKYPRACQNTVLGLGIPCDLMRSLKAFSKGQGIGGCSDLFWFLTTFVQVTVTESLDKALQSYLEKTFSEISPALAISHRAVSNKHKIFAKLYVLMYSDNVN